MEDIVLTEGNNELSVQLSPIVAPPPSLDLSDIGIMILQVGGKPLKNIGQYSACWQEGFCETHVGAELAEPIIVTDMYNLKIPVQFMNDGISVRPGVVGGIKAVGFESNCMGTTLIGQYPSYAYYDTPWGRFPDTTFQCGDGPEYKGYKNTPMGSNGIATMECASNPCWWCKGHYDLLLKVGQVPWDMPWIYGKSQTCIIKNAILTTKEGYIFKKNGFVYTP